MKKTSLLVLLLAAALAACITQPDEKSGGDGERHQAKPLALNKFEADSVDYSSGDRTDWKWFEVQDTGFLTVECVLDNQNAGITMILLDRYGHAVTRASHRRGDEPQFKMTAEVTLGKYFVQVYADKEGDRTGYTLRASVR